MNGMSPINRQLVPSGTTNLNNNLIDQISMIAQVVGAVASIVGLVLFMVYRPPRSRAAPAPLPPLLPLEDNVDPDVFANAGAQLETARTRTPDRSSSSRELQAADNSPHQAYMYVTDYICPF